VVEQEEVHGDVDGHEMMVIKLQHGKKEREKQKPRRSRQRYQIGFCFGTQDTIEGVSAFGIDSHTIKRGNISLSDYRVPLGDIILTYAFRDLVC
jgi:hypothetical protein